MSYSERQKMLGNSKGAHQEERCLNSYSQPYNRNDQYENPKQHQVYESQNISGLSTSNLDAMIPIDIHKNDPDSFSSMFPAKPNNEDSEIPKTRFDLSAINTNNHENYDGPVVVSVQLPYMNDFDQSGKQNKNNYYAIDADYVKKQLAIKDQIDKGKNNDFDDEDQDIAVEELPEMQKRSKSNNRKREGLLTEDLINEVNTCLSKDKFNGCIEDDKDIFEYSSQNESVDVNRNTRQTNTQSMHTNDLTNSNISRLKSDISTTDIHNVEQNRVDDNKIRQKQNISNPNANKTKYELVADAQKRMQHDKMEALKRSRAKAQLFAEQEERQRREQLEQKNKERIEREQKKKQFIKMLKNRDPNSKSIDFSSRVTSKVDCGPNVKHLEHKCDYMKISQPSLTKSSELISSNVDEEKSLDLPHTYLTDEEIKLGADLHDVVNAWGSVYDKEKIDRDIMEVDSSNTITKSNSKEPNVSKALREKNKHLEKSVHMISDDINEVNENDKLSSIEFNSLFTKSNIASISGYKGNSNDNMVLKRNVYISGNEDEVFDKIMQSKKDSSLNESEKSTEKKVTESIPEKTIEDNNKELILEQIANEKLAKSLTITIDVENEENDKMIKSISPKKEKKEEESKTFDNEQNKIESEDILKESLKLKEVSFDVDKSQKNKLETAENVNEIQKEKEENMVYEEEINKKETDQFALGNSEVMKEEQKKEIKNKPIKKEIMVKLPKICQKCQGFYYIDERKINYENLCKKCKKAIDKYNSLVSNELQFTEAIEKYEEEVFENIEFDITDFANDENENKSIKDVPINNNMDDIEKQTENLYQVNNETKNNDDEIIKEEAEDRPDILGNSTTGLLQTSSTTGLKKVKLVKKQKVKKIIHSPSNLYSSASEISPMIKNQLIDSAEVNFVGNYETENKGIEKNKDIKKNEENVLEYPLDSNFEIDQQNVNVINENKESLVPDQKYESEMIENNDKLKENNFVEVNLDHICDNINNNDNNDHKIDIENLVIPENELIVKEPSISNIVIDNDGVQNSLLPANLQTTMDQKINYLDNPLNENIIEDDGEEYIFGAGVRLNKYTKDGYGPKHEVVAILTVVDNPTDSIIVRSASRSGNKAARSKSRSSKRYPIDTTNVTSLADENRNLNGKEEKNNDAVIVLSWIESKKYKDTNFVQDTKNQWRHVIVENILYNRVRGQHWNKNGVGHVNEIWFEIKETGKIIITECTSKFQLRAIQQQINEKNLNNILKKNK